jgi:branched-chain amino acid transport system substrate-binding protein
MEAFLGDESALFILGGIHSPPLIRHRSWINDNRIPVVVPWAAGGPITRHPSKDNWIFRCSVDDTKAGQALADFSTQTKGMKNPAMVMEDTPWGRGNHRNVSAALLKTLGVETPILWFDWNTKEAGAKIKLRSLLKKGHDGIILVGNAVESLAFCKAMVSMDQKVPIVSHWGITGGDFQEKLGSELLKQLDLSFIQTRFSFVSSQQNEFSQNVWSSAVSLFPKELNDPKKLVAPTGFIHAYDLGKIALEAMRTMEWGESPKASRGHFRLAMENLQKPVEGLVKTYEKPFRAWTENDPDAHEALGQEDLAFGRFTTNGSIELIATP